MVQPNVRITSGFQHQQPELSFLSDAHSCITFPLLHARSQNNATEAKENEHCCSRVKHVSTTLYIGHKLNKNTP